MNALDLTPQAIAEAEETSDRVVLIRPRPASGGWRAPLDWLIYLLAPKRLRLDEFGSFCWRLVDGERTPWDIAKLMREKFGETCEPAEERVAHFLKLLEREELVRLSQRS